MADSILPRQDTQDSGDQLLRLFADPFQSQIQINAFWASLGLSLGVSTALALLFSLLRPRHSLVYAPRSRYADSAHTLPPMGKGLFGWIKPVWSAKEDLIVEKLGLDAAIFLRFTRMLRNIFVVLAALGVVIMIPVNVTTGVGGIQDKSNVFAIMTPLYTFGQGLWAQVVVAYAIDLVVIYFIWANYRKVQTLRRAYFNSSEYQGSLSARSVLLRHIPSKLRNEEGILKITDEVNPTGALPIPIAMRNVKDIPELIEKHEETVRKLEAILAKYLKNPDRLPARRPMMKPPKAYEGATTEGKVDAIDFYRKQIENLERNINGIRGQIDSRDIMPFGFASWDHVAQAHTVAYAARKKSPQGTKIRQAPRPNDIIWGNMPLSKAQLRHKAFMNGVWVAVLTILWTPINACLAVFLSNLSNLGSLWPSFQTQLNEHRTFWSIVQGIAAPAITSAVYLLLPIIFRRLQIRAGDVTKTARERHVLRNLFNFFILNNLLIFSLFSAIWQYVTSVINESNTQGVWGALQQGDFFLTVTTQLCQSISVFWVNWILQRNLGAAIDLAQLWTLFYQWFAKTFLAPTPRQFIEWTAPARFNYAGYYNYFLFYTAVSLCFATLQPIILVCTAIYFVMDSVLKKYLLMYVFVTKTESGGQMWKTLINRMIFSCVLADVIIGVVVKARGSWTMVFALLPLVVMLVGFKWYCMKTFDPDMDYYQRNATHANDNVEQEPSSKSVNRAAARFRHPVLDKKLMTPMVSANAKHVVQRIYAGRLGSEVDAGPSAFADIPMQPIKQADDPSQHQSFETVPDAQLDYAFYKNRSDFGEVGGDRLSRYDMIISRPGTPASFGASRAQSPYNDLKSTSPYDSRSASPAPIHRKEVGTKSSHHALRSQHSRYSSLTQMESTEDGDVSMHPQHGPYTDPNDDRANLLTNAGPDLHEPNGEFMSVERWRTPGGTPYTPGDNPSSYDYFRGHGGLR
ncbi:hypothetical protein LTR70_010684 [Exophiala xenobiotica]|uniref:DUF221-domain-containing protein n=1 Tax=Lithohypha guttulata TaxID=1690604 RepID=A0ABR0JTL1_9EURO|nr:hypothetical protein LTR24_010671 [Lithohypha guttulata]KAK5308999.1 hypothetical protein LTR70_010684 [Exophiala xenobiotica]